VCAEAARDLTKAAFAGINERRGGINEIY